MLRVIRNHRRAAHGESDRLMRGSPCCRCRSMASEVPDPALADAAREAWDEALRAGETHGYRNAQTTVIAPTGTIGLVMDCDTTGIEPDFALVKFKKLAGGGYFKIINRMVPMALSRLGYDAAEIDGNHPLCRRSRHAEDGPRDRSSDARRERLQTTKHWRRSRMALRDAFDIRFVFNKWTLGERFCVEHLGIPAGTPGPTVILPVDRARLHARRRSSRRTRGCAGR